MLGVQWPIGDTIFFATNSSIARLEIISRIASIVLITHPEEKKKVDAFVKRAKAVMGKRHDIIHAMWMLAERGTHVERLKLGSFTTGRVKVTLKELEAISQDVARLYSEVIRYNTSFSKDFKRSGPKLGDYWVSAKRARPRK